MAKIQTINTETGEVIRPIVTYRNYQYSPTHGAEKHDTTRVSLTVPDQAMSLKEILYRHTNGQSVGTNNGLNFTGESFMPNVKKMDLTEVSDLKQQNQQFIDNLRKEVAEKMELRNKTVQEKRKKDKEIFDFIQKQKLDGQQPDLSKK